MRQDKREHSKTAGAAVCNSYPRPAERIDVEHLEEQGQLSLIIDSAPSGMILVNSTGVVELVNKQVERMFGYQRSELLGQSVEILLPERFKEKHPAMRSGYQADPSARAMGIGRDLFGRRKDGSEFPIEIVLNPIPTTVGTWVLSSVADVTLRKLAEAKVKEAAQLKSQFLANMSHEIRTPMNVIIGMSNLILETELTAEQRGFAEMIASGSEALLTIINDVLDFSKIEAGKLDITEGEFDLVATVEDAAAFLAESAARKGIELTCEAAPVPSAVLGDAGRIRQVLVNILGNAVKFTERGSVHTSMTWESGGPERLNARFEVRDTGIGMNGQTLQSLFEPFIQADGSQTRRYGGTGLGLAISKNLVDLMGGEIGASSELGKGTNFWFSVPLKTFIPGPEEPALHSKLAGCHALVVDDNEVNRKILKTQLGNWSFRVTTAEGALEALQLLRGARAQKTRYDVILLDQGLPEMDGLDLVRIIRSDRDLAAIPIILLTSYSGRKSHEEIREVGVDVHLSRPVQSRWLRDVLEQLLTEPRQKRIDKRPPRGKPAAEPIRCRPTLLLVEDNEGNRQVALTLLSRLGYTCDVAVNGLEATRAVCITRYPLVLMDLQMPVMDGLTASAEIRKSEQGGYRTRIVAMTANAMVGDRERCLKAGIDDYLPKPFHRRELEAVLRKWLDPVVAGSPIWSGT